MPIHEGAFSGPSEFAQCIRDALACAAQEGWQEMVWSDATFEDWPLRELAVVESLQLWARTGRRLVLLAKSYDSVLRSQPRFVRWRVMWDHKAECRICKGVDSSEFPSALWGPHWALRRLDVIRSTGMASTEPRRRIEIKESLDELHKQSAPGFSASILGL